MNELIEQLPKMELYTVIMCPVKYLKPAEYNPRTIDEEEMKALKLSMTKNQNFLRARPPIVNTMPGREGVIIGGNQRVKAAIEMGWEKLPVIFVRAETIEDEKAWNILDNKEAGQWDRAKLKDLLGDLHSAQYDMTGIGHTPMQLADLMTNMPSMDDAKDTDGYKKNGTTPSKWRQCPECGHSAPKKDFKAVDPQS